MLHRPTRFSTAVTVAAWALKQPFLHDLRLSLTHIILAAASLLLEGLAVSALMLYTNTLDLDTATASITFNDINLTVSLIVLVMIVLTLLVLGGLFRLLSRIALTSLASRFEERITLDLLTNPGNINLGPVTLLDQSKQSPRFLKSIALKRARLAGRILGVLMQGLMDAMRALVFLCLCLYLAPGVTLVLCATTLAFFIVQLRLGEKIHENQVERERMSPAVNKEMNDMLSFAFDNAGTRDEVARGVASLYEHSWLKKLRARYRRHINSASYSEFIGTLNLAVGTAIGAYLIADSVNQENMQIADIVAYIVAVRFLLVSTRSMFGTIGSFSKLYNHVSVIFETMYDRPDIALATEPCDSESAGTMQAIISNARLDRITAAQFFKRLPQSERVEGHFIILPDVSALQESSFEELTGYPSLVDFRDACKTRPDLKPIWAAWQAYCVEKALDPTRQQSWSMGSQDPEGIYPFTAAGLESRKIGSVIIPYGLRSQADRLLQIIHELDPSVSIYIYLSAEQLPCRLDSVATAYIFATNGHIARESLEWANQNVYSVHETLKASGIPEGNGSPGGDWDEIVDGDL